MNTILTLELIVGIIISFTLLGIFIWSAKDGNFDDSKKQMDGLLFDSVDDLNDAVKKEQKIKDLRAKKAQNSKKDAN